MRYFFSTGEASGEYVAVLLAQAIRELDAQAAFEGIGSNAMREAGFTLWREHSGWASFGPFAAIPRIPKLLAAGLATARHLTRSAPDALVLVDFGAFNLRLARVLRGRGSRVPIIDIFPPGAWLDQPARAHAVARVATPLTAFEHQRDFYRSLGLEARYFGHPLADQYAMREPRAPAPPRGGTVAILPGSRPAELRLHAPVIFRALRALQVQRPELRAQVGIANERAEPLLRQALQGSGATAEFVFGVRAALDQADAAWVASGTAVLETALLGVPSIAFYRVSEALARYVRRVYKRRYYTLPNLVLDRQVVPELMQDAATPEHLCECMDALLRDPATQYAELVRLREALGPPGALERCARFIVESAARGAC